MNKIDINELNKNINKVIVAAQRSIDKKTDIKNIKELKKKSKQKNIKMAIKLNPIQSIILFVLITLNKNIF